MLAYIAILTALASAPFIAAQSTYYPPPVKTYSGPALQLDVELDAGIYVESTDATGGAWGGCGGGFEFEFKDQYTAEPFEMRLYKTNDRKCEGKPTAKAQCTVLVPTNIPTTREFVTLQSQAPWVDILPGDPTRKISVACATPTP